ncbi:MAG: hypothetical protein GTO24_12930 [candidate division Zixibacteria bacterium]|nr:hypothetical protein [candidate division Zixibacteria bacterium]
MKKRIIFLALCSVLFLIFTSLGYGGYDPKYKVKADPRSDLLGISQCRHICELAR